MMTPQHLPGAMYVDAWPSGEWVALVPHGGFQSYLGAIDLPPGEGYGLMFPVSTRVGGFRFGGQAHDTLDPAAWEWSAATGWRSFPPPCGGVWAAIYDNAGVLHRSDLSIGSQGWRYVDPSGALITGDDTLHDPVSGLFEWTQLPGGLKIGQGQNGGAWVWDGAVRRLLHPGDCFAIRARQIGDQISVAFYTSNDGAYIYRGSQADFAALPVEESPTPAPPPPPPPPPPPTPAPVITPEPAPMPLSLPANTTSFDPAIVTFLDNPGDLASWPETARLTSVQFPGNRICVDHDHRSGSNAWPDAPFGDGKGGTCQYTLGLCMQIGGRWFGSAVIQFWQGRELSEGGDVSRIAQDWYYDANRWGALAGHQPALGEPVAWFVAAGNLRDNERIGVRERSNFLLLPYGQSYTAPVVLIPAPPVVVPDPPVVVPPIVAPALPPAPLPSPPPPAPALDLAAVLTAIQTASTNEIAKLDEIKVAFEKSVSELKSSLPAVLGALAGSSSGLGGLLGGLVKK